MPKKKPRRRSRRARRLSATDATPPTVTLVRTFKIPVESRGTLRRSVPVTWTNWVVSGALHALYAPNDREATRRHRALRKALRLGGKGGRPKGPSTRGHDVADVVRAVCLAVIATHMRRSEMLRELGKPTRVDTYHWLRRQIKRGRAMLDHEKDKLPHELRPEHLRKLPPPERDAVCRRALRKLASGVASL